MPQRSFWKPLTQINLRKYGMTILGVVIALGIIVTLAGLYFMNAGAVGPSAAEARIQGWVGQLHDTELTPARHLAQQNLEKAGDSAVDPLVSALHSPDSTLRRNSAEMLGFIASPRSLDGLSGSLANDPVSSVRARAAWALGELHDTRAVNALVLASVLDQDIKVRREASGSLDALRANLAESAGKNERITSAFATAPGDANIIYLAEMNHISISHDGGKSWNPAPASPPSRVTALAVNPSDVNEVFAGTESMGLYESTDGGNTWASRNEGLGLDPGVRLTVTAIAIDPSNTDRVYLATGEWIGTSEATLTPLGIKLSSDRGLTWQPMTMVPVTSATTRLVIFGNTLYALTGDRVTAHQL